jgi:hypothetical protein
LIGAAHLRKSDFFLLQIDEMKTFFAHIDVTVPIFGTVGIDGRLCQRDRKTATRYAAQISAQLTVLMLHPEGKMDLADSAALVDIFRLEEFLCGR